MGDVWESSALIEEVWESGSTPGVEWTVVIREGDIVTGGSGVDLSDTTPQALGTAAPGVGTEAARDDHVHAMPTAADVGADPAGTAAGLVDDLSGVSDQSTARTNLGLGSAATAATGDFAAASHTHTGTQVAVDASGFNGNLTTSDDTVQEIAQKLDDLVIAAGSDGYSQSFLLGGM